MSFRDDCIEPLSRTATGSLARRTLLAPLAGIAFFVSLVLIVWLSLGADRLFSLPPLLPEPWDIVVAWPLLAAGATLVLTTVLQFLMARGTPVPLFPPPKLITSGLYAITRNPMLSGVLFILFGTGFVFNSICLTLLTAPALVFVMTLWVRTIEEPELERRLGPEYLEYKGRVPRFFPKFPW